VKQLGGPEWSGLAPKKLRRVCCGVINKSLESNCHYIPGAARAEAAGIAAPAADVGGRTLSLALISTIMAALAVGAEPLRSKRSTGVVNGIPWPCIVVTPKTCTNDIVSKL